MSKYLTVTVAGTALELGKVQIKATVLPVIEQATKADAPALRTILKWALQRKADLQYKKAVGKAPKFYTRKVGAANQLIEACKAKGIALIGAKQPQAAAVSMDESFATFTEFDERVALTENELNLLNVLKGFSEAGLDVAKVAKLLG